MLKLLETLLTEDLSLDKQVDILSALNQVELNGGFLYECVELIYELHQGRPLLFSALDIVGTGGDQQGTFNISTTAAFVIAGANVPVLKHGSVSVSSRSGSIDCLRALGIEPLATKIEVLQQLETYGLSFLFARDFYPSLGRLRAARQVLKERGQRTLINLLGPLLHPLNVSVQILGVHPPHLLKPMSEAMQLLGRRGFVVSSPYTDELTLLEDNVLLEVTAEGIRPCVLDFAALGLTSAPISALLGGDAIENARSLSAIIKGDVQGARQDVVCLNAMLGISAYRGVSFKEAFAEAYVSIATHKAQQKLISLRGKDAHVFE